ncbi:MBL fold metallo-hydrolase [candidate division KSB1 bacterium]|nr:MBL fold metallo-hydrolase [candidate division KSB1 bacterium]
MKPFSIASDIHWVGALHPDLRIFDIIMKTKNGSTYNSYLLNADKTLLIDTVKSKFTDLFLQNISQLMDLEKLDYIVVQHTEPDHSGSLIALLDKAPDAEILCSKSAVKFVKNTINRDAKITPVGDGSTIDLGGKTLEFLQTPFLHWPDTMMTYCHEDRLLFPCDVFANHFCDSRMFDDAITRDFAPDFELYFNIIFRPFKKNVQNALAKLGNFDVQMIAPSHGPIIRSSVHEVMTRYDQWSRPVPENSTPRCLVYYVSAHGNTEIMAKIITEALKQDNMDVELYDLTQISIDEQLDNIEACDAILVGSPTINNDAVKPVWELLTSLTTLNLKGKLAASFGSIGWSGESVKFIDERLKALKFKVPFEGVTCKLVPDEEELQSCRQLAHKVAETIKA